MSIFKQIKENSVPFIIAEAGVNHNGSMELAKKLIDAAVDSGVDAVKFQTFTAENVVTEDASMADYQEENTGVKESQLDMIRKFELSFKDFKELKEYCDDKKILFLSTPHSPDAVDFLDPLIPMYKLGSGDLTNIPFLEDIGKRGKPVILSTGMAVMEEIREAVETLQRVGNNEIIVLQCTTDYPCDLKDVNLRVMETLQKEFPDVLVGYSDHTLGIDVSKLAAEHGAKLIEDHFTLAKNMEGPDHKASLDPEELKQLVNDVKNSDYETSLDVELVMGSSEKTPTPEEIEIAKVARKSIVVNQDIPKESVVTKDMLIIKRPGTGITSNKLNEVIGKTAKVDLKKDTLLKFEDLE